MSLYDQMRMDHYTGNINQGHVPNYSVLDMKTHIDNLEHGLYPSALEYLTDTTSEDSRHIRKETLEKFKVGLG